MFHVEQRGNVGILSLDDGRVNAMSPAWVEGFPTAFRDAARGPRPVVILGTPKALSAGLDLKVLVTLDAAQRVAFARGFMRAFADVLSHPAPVVVGVDGAAIAGGSVIALSADFRVGTPRARMGLPEVSVGIPFPAPVLELARARLPEPEARQAILRGTLREGHACLDHGWIDSIVDPNALRDACVTLAAELGAQSPLAFGMAKTQLNEALVRSFHEFDKNGAEPWAALLAHADTRAALERTLAKLAKRG